MTTIDSRSRRSKLSPGKRHWHVIEPGLAIGYRRPNRGGAGSWYVRAMIGTNHKIAVIGTADDLADADGSSLLSWKHAQQAARDWLGKQTVTGPVTVEAAVACHVKDLHARKGERAARDVMGRMRKHLPSTLAARRLADLTTAELVAWRNGLVPAPGDGDGDEEEVRRRRDTANRVLTMLKAALNHAFNTGVVHDDRAWRRLKPFQDVGAARKVILSDVELQRLIDACRPGLRELVLLGALTGARLGELAGARVRDLDLEAAILTVAGKTGERAIHLPPAAASLLHQAASGKRPDQHLLTPAAGGRWTKSLHTRPFAAAVKLAGLDPDTVYYSLRHTWISRALVAGVPVKAVGDHCGTSIAMLQRYYAKFIPGDQSRYATMAAPDLEIAGAGAKVVRLQRE